MMRTSTWKSAVEITKEMREREREILNKVSEWVSGYNVLHYIF